jgi:hypothetical protein
MGRWNGSNLCHGQANALNASASRAQRYLRQRICRGLLKYTQALRNAISRGEQKVLLLPWSSAQLDRASASERGPPNTIVFIDHIDG